MNYAFVPMTLEYATAIVGTWKYSGDFGIYDYAHEAEHMLDPEGWGTGVFAVLEAHELVGELSIEFYDERGHYTEYSQYGNRGLINSRELWLGWGLRPDLVGQGRGAAFVQACVDFAVGQTGYCGSCVHAGVASFNMRAIRAYERAGFEIYDRTCGPIASQVYEVVYMRKALPSSMNDRTDTPFKSAD